MQINVIQFVESFRLRLPAATLGQRHVPGRGATEPAHPSRRQQRAAVLVEPAAQAINSHDVRRSPARLYPRRAAALPRLARAMRMRMSWLQVRDQLSHEQNRGRQPLPDFPRTRQRAAA
jgi:hypothetical protein